MVKKLGVVFAALAVVLVVSSRYASRVFGAANRHVLITQPIDESQLVRLARNTRPEANAKNDRGAEPEGFLMDHMLLQLKRDPQVESEFAAYIETLTDKSSPNFRHWMMPAEQGEKYGVDSQDIDTITAWLQSHGFTVGYVYPNHMVIDFSGTAGQIREAFHTEIHELNVNGESHFANMSDPKVPAALAPAIEGVVSMNNFKPHSFVERRKPSQITFSGCGGDCFDLVPADIQTVYNVTPLYKAGLTGKGMTVVVIEDTNSYSNDWATYQKTFGLTSYAGTLTTVHPDDAKNCTNPGTNDADIEADLDVEMVTAVAPAAHVELVSCKDTTTFGGLLAIENLLSAGSPPPILSMSYGVCEVVSGAALNAAFNSAFQSAAAAGVSVFVSAGDNGPSLCARDFTDDAVAYPGIGVTGWGETIYNVSVGGTDFEDVYNANEGGKPLSTYWNTTNSSTYGSAKSYIPEIPWNTSCAGYLLYHIEGYPAAAGSAGFCSSAVGIADFQSTGAGSGGPSNCAKGAGNATGAYIEDTSCVGYAKPSWQTGIFGNPSDGVRDVPDVSLFASDGIPWSHAIIECWSDVANGGTPCTGAPSTWIQVGGTSASAPMLAAMQAIVDEKWNIRAGNPNPTYYKIAKTEFGASGDTKCYSVNQTSTASSCVFYDITQGDNDVDCQHNGTYMADCRLPSGTVGAIGTQPISSLTLKAAGSGYTSTPTCTIGAPANKSKYLSPTGSTIYGGGAQATCTVTINTTTHVVKSVTLTAGGQGYTGVPTCTISGGGGTGATCYAVVSPTTAPAAYQAAFGATPGWDMSTGIGSVNAYNLVENTSW